MIKKENSNKNEKILHTSIHSQARSIGNTHSMLMEIKSVIDQCGKICVVGCKKPLAIINQLKTLGINAKAEKVDGTSDDIVVFELKDNCMSTSEKEEDLPYCTDCGNEDLAYIDQYANGEYWRCRECEREFIW